MATDNDVLTSHERRLNTHAERLRALEDFRLLHQQTEKQMREALQDINKKLEHQDAVLEMIKNKMSRWGGMVTVIIAVPAVIITTVEIIRLFK